ncbi:MAG: YkvA family protein [Burkholderiales bacterium]
MRILKRWSARVASLKTSTYALYLAMRDPRVPRPAKLVITGIVAYALSPIDLIPDFIPVLGLLDELILLPIAISLAIKMIPDEIWDDCRARAGAAIDRDLPHSRSAFWVIIAIWLSVAALIAYFVWRWLADRQL